MTPLPQHQDFIPFLGKRFDFDGQRVALRLVSVDEKRRHPGTGADRSPFSLIFHGPANDLLPEGLYQAQIEGGGKMELYVMPIHTVERDRQAYQAVFN